MEFIFLNSFDSLEHLAMLQTSKFKRIVVEPNFSDQFIKEWDTTWISCDMLRCIIYRTTESVMVAYTHKYAKV